MRPTELARLAEVSTDTLRVYEAKGLLPKARRSPNGYREYAPEACARVRLVRRALALGFTLEELRRILATRDRGGAPCREVRAIGERKLALLDARVAELQEARNRLRDVLERWDVLLGRTPQGARAALLDALEGLVEAGSPSPFLPPGLRRKRKSP
jgi:MerR family Zn(II)-responsive transcriptional regulator of zntA